MAFLKQASLKIQNPEVTVNTWVGNRGNIKTAANKLVEYKKIIADFHPDNYLLTHCTIVASVDVENAAKPLHFGSPKTKDQYGEIDGRSDYYITPSTSKYMNANGDAWSRDLLKKSYRTFIGAENYVEHVQDPALSKGKILDAVAREVDEGKSVFVDILVATNKKHSDLVKKIKTGDLQTLSMGAIVAFTVCSQCGRVASDETELCQHIKFLKKNSFISENDGKKRITAELCGHFLYPESNRFIEGSWVETPAFKGAVMRNEVTVNTLDKVGFIDSIEPALLANLKISDKSLAKTASRLFKAFQIVDHVKKSFTEDVAEEDEDEEALPEVKTKKETPEIEDVKDLPIDKMEEEINKEEESPDSEEPKEDSEEDSAIEEPEEDSEESPEDSDEPKEDSEESPENSDEDLSEERQEELPAEIKEMGEPPDSSKPDEKEKALEQEAKKPYDVLKEEIKLKLKEEIKKELLRDLGIDIDTKPTPSSMDNVNLNDSIIKSSINRIKSACIMAKEVGLKNIAKHGFSNKEMVKIAELSGKYSINKEVFNAIGELEQHKFPTFRRFAKAVELRLGRDLSSFERDNLDNLIQDLFT